MKKLLFIFLSVTLLFCACSNSSSSSSNSIIGTWKEHRADPSDDYGLGEYSFNRDGSGIFKVYGISNTQKMSFLWEKDGASRIKISSNSDVIYLELNNGLLIEKSSFGTIVYKKR